MARSQLNSSNPYKFKNEILISLENLSLKSQNITNLTGIETFNHLKKVSLANNLI